MPHRPDETFAKNQDSDFSPHTEGQHVVLCADVINLGTKVEQYKTNPAREVEKAALVFVSGERNDDKSLRLITTEMTISMGEQSNMRPFLERWRGKSYTDAQVEAGVPLHKLYGQPALVTIEHVTTSKKRKFAKIVGIGPLPKVMTPPDAKLLDEYERPKYFADKKDEYAKGVAKFRAEAHGDTDDPPEPEYPGDEEPDDDLPF